MLDQIAQHGVGEPVLVRPLRIAENAIELIRVRRLNSAHGRLNSLSHILRGLPHLSPVGISGNLKTRLLLAGCVAFVAARFRQRHLRLFVKHVAHALVKQ